MINKELDIADVAKILCAHKIKIHGDKKTIEGCPKDLARQFNLGPFIKSLNKYVPEGKLEIIWSSDGKEYQKYLHS